MQHHSSLRKDSAVAAAILNVVKVQEPVKASQPFQLRIVAAGITYTAAKKKSSTQSRRYTIDDNGGSYEGL